MSEAKYKGLGDFLKNSTDEEKHVFFAKVIKESYEKQMEVIRKAGEMK